MTHPHFATGVNVADVTLLLHHYKLSGDWLARDRIAIRQLRWKHVGPTRRLAIAGEDADAFRLLPAEPRPWRGVEALLDEGFLYASPRFRRAMGLPQSPPQPPDAA